MDLRSRIERAKAKNTLQERFCMNDAEAFLGSYRETLAEEVSGGIWPSELTSIYEPESCLKHSGAKEVYLVIDKRTGGRAVLRASDLDAGERADAEHAILSRLDFPGIPKTYGTFVKEGRSYLAREYFEGEPLDQVVARGTLQLAQIYLIAKQLCMLLGYLHSQNPPVIHRDIKPQNIIMRPDGSLGLTDFGIARTFKEDSVSDTQYMGTLLYAPPEQYGYAQSSPQTDIYALGIVLIYLATGTPDRRDLGKRISDPQLRALIEKCIAFDPKNRFQNVEQVVRRINSMKSRKTRMVVVLLTGCLVLGLLGVGIWQVVPRFLENNQTAQEETDEGGGALFDNGSETTYSSSSDPQIGSLFSLYDYNYAGNLHGNINNGGFAAAADRGDALYVMSDGDIYKVDEEGNVLSKVQLSARADSSLNICGDDLYFASSQGNIHKIDLRDNEETELSNMYAESVYFDKGQMFYTNMLDGLDLYTAGTDGSSQTAVCKEVTSYYTNIVDGIIYYSDGNQGSRIYACDVLTGETTLIYNKPAIWLSVCNGRIYFEDDDAGRLASIKLDGSDYRVVYDQPCYYIVASPHGVFAINAMTKELVVVDAVTGEHLVLLDHDGKFCVVNGWVVYRGSYTDTALGMVSSDGTQHIEFNFAGVGVEGE